MNSTESDFKEWGSQLFSPSNSIYPVKVFISVLEHSAKDRGLFDAADIIAYAISMLDTAEIPRAKIELLSHQVTWENFKSVLLLAYNKMPSLDEKVDLFRSLTKGANEDCYHYLIRVRYAADLIKNSVTCSCDKGSINVEDWAKILFMAGIEPYERNVCK